MHSGSVFLLDVISLAVDSLERLNSVPERARIVVHTERAGSEAVTAAKGFKLVVTMNPGGNARRNSTPLCASDSRLLGLRDILAGVSFSTSIVTAKVEIIYPEVARENVCKLEAYVEEVSNTDNVVTDAINMEKIQEDVLKVWNVFKTQPEISEEQKSKIKDLYASVPRTRRASLQFLRPHVANDAPVAAEKVPLLHFKRKVGANWKYSSNLTGVYLGVLHEVATPGSIGVEILKGLLSGGAHVVITTSRYSRPSVEYYQGIFQRFGLRGSALTVVPFNQGSKQDVEAVVNYIYGTLGLDLDYILPFAGAPKNGREIDGLDDKSELAHRIMPINLKTISQLRHAPDAGHPSAFAQPRTLWQRRLVLRVEDLTCDLVQPLELGEYLGFAGAVIVYSSLRSLLLTYI
ncbi:unnamed protein product [Peniophora sp. CBMAI 1063]|nr:unnamed protein product [Peniophora sp. CBMAI 1063]